MEKWYDSNKCLDKARLFVLCMKETPLNPLENKCKNLFDNWSKCIIDLTKDEIYRNYTLKKNIK
jgi:hypothetical protein